MTSALFFATTLFGLAAMAGAARADAPDGEMFVNAFRQACVPQRASYEGTIANLKSIGWAEVDPTVDPQLQKLVQVADTTVLDAARARDEDWKYTRTVFAAYIKARPHFAMVTRLDAPDVVTLVGCYLYDLGATEPIDPEIVTAFLGVPVAETIEEKGMTGYNWGPSPKLGRTLETDLFFITKGSPMRDASGFAGVMLKFETSEPNGAE